MKILYVGEFCANNSFSNVNRNLLLQFLKSDLEVSVWNTRPCEKDLSFEEFWVAINKWAPGMFDGHEEKLQRSFLGPERYNSQYEFDISLYFVSTLDLPAAGNYHRLPLNGVREKYRIGYYVWSHLNAPSHWIRNIVHFDEVWTPSEANRDAFIKAGAPEDMIHVMPHGFNSDVFPKTPLGKNERFRFGMCNSICYYKGADIALEAFFEEFEPHEPVEFYLQSSHRDFTGNDKHGHWYKDYINILNHYPKQMHTYYTSKECGPAGIAEFIRDCDCIVSVHRGEGFGMIPLESMASGRPVIVSRSMGPVDYLPENHDLFVDGEVAWTNRKSGKAHFPDGGDETETYYYFEPNKAQVRKAMRHAFINARGHGSSNYKFWSLKPGFEWERIFKDRILKRFYEVGVNLNGCDNCKNNP